MKAKFAVVVDVVRVRVRVIFYDIKTSSALVGGESLIYSSTVR